MNAPVYGTGRNQFRFSDNGPTVDIVSVVDDLKPVRCMKGVPNGVWAVPAVGVRPRGSALYDCATQACNIR